MSVINLSYIQSQFGSDPSFAYEVLEMFHATAPDKLRKIRAYIESEEWEQIYQTAHSLKASIKMLGMDPLFETVRQVEDASRSKSLGELRVLVTQMERQVKEAEEEIEDILEAQY